LLIYEDLSGYPSQAQYGPDWARTSDPALIKRML
jgi:hypothetical protein